jgi:hypothetical protein
MEMDEERAPSSLMEQLRSIVDESFGESTTLGMEKDAERRSGFWDDVVVDEDDDSRRCVKIWGAVFLRG